MIIYVPLENIVDNPHQKRRDYGDVAGLAADIARNGLLQTPVGRLTFDHGEVITGYDLERTLGRIQSDGFPAGLRVELAFGHRRLRAYRHIEQGEFAGGDWSYMPVIISELTDDQMLDHVWSENQARADINPVEQAELLKEKLERARAAGGNQTTVAEAWGLDRSTVANKLRLLELPADAQAAVREGKLSERAALALLQVVDLEEKVAGADVAWGDTGRQGWHPRSPAGYLAQVLDHPEKITSDAIREYAQTAARHAGREMGDDFARFEAGDGPGIVQSVCKGCPRRHNQACLQPACFDARHKRYVAMLGARAAEETGLPYSDDAADFPDDWKAREALDADWEAGRREGMVCGICIEKGYPLRPYTNQYFVYDKNVLQDWRTAIIIGRPASAVVIPTEEAGLPDAADVARWQKAQKRGDRERLARTRDALKRAAAGVIEDDETALCALVGMLCGYDLRRLRDAGERPDAAALFDLLFDYAWKHAETHSYDATNRETLRDLLDAAAISPDIVDPPDRTLRLADVAQDALLKWHGNRHHVGTAQAYTRLRLLRDALAEFDRAGAFAAGDGELERLEEYLRACVAYEEGKLAEGTESEITPDDLDRIALEQAESEGWIDVVEGEAVAQRARLAELRASAAGDEEELVAVGV